MKFNDLSSQTLNEWQESEKAFVSSVSMSQLPEDHYQLVKNLIPKLFPDLRNKRMYSNFLFNTSVTVQIPFTCNLIVDIRPYQSEKVFIQHYGITAKEIASLTEEGYIIPQFGSDIHRYKNRNYLIPIFNACNHESSNYRINRIFEIIDSRYYESRKKTKKDLSKYFKYHWRKAPAVEKQYYMNDFDAFSTAWATRIVRIGCISPIFGKILMSYARRDDFLIVANLFTSIFVFPVTKSLGGVYKMSLENYLLLKNSFAETTIKKKRIMPFARDIAEPLCEAINLSLPEKMSIKSLSKYLKDDLVEEGNRLMFEIESHISKRTDKAKSRADALREVWIEMTEMINKNEKRKNILSRSLNLGLASFVGATLWSKLDFSALLYLA